MYREPQYAESKLLWKYFNLIIICDSIKSLSFLRISKLRWLFIGVILCQCRILYSLTNLAHHSTSASEYFHPLERETLPNIRTVLILRRIRFSESLIEKIDSLNSVSLDGHIFHPSNVSKWKTLVFYFSPTTIQIIYIYLFNMLSKHLHNHWPSFSIYPVDWLVAVFVGLFYRRTR